MGGCSRTAVFLTLLLVLCGVPLRTADAQFADPVQVSAVAGTFQNPDLVIGDSNYVAVLFETGTDLYFSSTLLGFGAHLPVTQTPLPSTQGRVTPGSAAILDVVYTEQASMPGQTGTEVFLRQSNGGTFGQAINLTGNNGIDDSAPVLVRNQLGDLDVAWQLVSGSSSPEIWLSRNQGPDVLIGLGQSPAVADLGGGVTFVGYERAGILYGRTFDGVTVGPEETVANDVAVNSTLDLAADGAGVLHCVYLAGDAVKYVARSVAGVIGTSVTRDAGPITGEPRIAAGSAGVTALTFARAGHVYLHLLQGGIWTQDNLTSFVSTALAPDVGICSLDHVHVAYQLYGAIFYTTNTPPPSVAFSSTTSVGELPLLVEFTNLTTGVFTSILWDFGDGATSQTLDAAHLYVEPGTYTVSLTATGPGGSNTFTEVDLVQAALPADVLEMADIELDPGQTGVVHPIMASHTVPIQGFQLALRYDDTITPISELTLVSTVTEAFAPDWISIALTPNLAQSSLTCAVVLESQTPFEGLVIPAANRQAIAALVYDLPASLPIGTTSEFIFADDLGIENIFSPGVGPSIHPYPLHGSMTIVDPLGLVGFLRGDSNGNGSIDIADAIYSLGYLFSNGPPPPCWDAADANDNGTMDIADAIYTLGYLFTNGSPPPYPFPNSGYDPTEDTLGPCNP